MISNHKWLTCTEEEHGLSDVLKGRVAAARAYVVLLTSGKHAAMEWYRENAPKTCSRSSSNMMRDIKHWGMALEQYGSVFDRPRSGRPSIIDTKDAVELARLMAAGYYVMHKRCRLWRGFCTLQQTVEKVPQARRIIDKYPDVNMGSVMRRINQLVPWLAGCKRKVDFKTELDPETKEERAKGAAEHTHKALEELRAVVWTDEKKVVVSAPSGLKVYDPDDERVVEDSRLPKGKFHKGIHLNYYAAVNALVGVVVFVWVTGTTGLKSNEKTQVGFALLERCYISQQQRVLRAAP